MKISLKQLEVFAEVAKHLSFTKAAKRLNLSQPAISRQIKNLEDQINKPVFEQIGKRVFLTDTGLEVLKHVEIIGRDVDELKAQLTNTDNGMQGRITLSMASCIQHVMFDKIGAFYKENPQTEFRISVMSRPDLIQQLHTNQLDFALMGEMKAQKDLDITDLSTQPFLLVAKPDHPLAKKEHVGFEDLKEEIFIMEEKGNSNYDFVTHLIKKVAPEKPRTIEIKSLSAILYAVMAGLGISFVPEFMAKPELKNHNLTVLNIPNIDAFASTCLVHHKDKELSPIARAFKDFLITAAKMSD